MTFTVLATLAVCLLLLDLILFSHEQYVWSVIIFLGGIAGFGYLQDLHQVLSPIEALKYGAMYLGAGCGVAALKWIHFQVKSGRKLAEYREQFIRKSPTVTERGGQEDIRQFAEFLFEKLFFFHIRNNSYEEVRREAPYVGDVAHMSSHEKHYAERDGKLKKYVTLTKADLYSFCVPQTKNFVSDFTVWAIVWPVTLLAFLFEDIVMRIGEWLSDVFNLLLTRFSKYIVRKSIAIE